MIYYINIFILFIFVSSNEIKSSYIELTISGPGISGIFFENVGKKYNGACPNKNLIIPDKVIINGIEQR